MSNVIQPLQTALIVEVIQINTFYLIEYLIIKLVKFTTIRLLNYFTNSFDIRSY